MEELLFSEAELETESLELVCQALVNGACPKLRRLGFKDLYGDVDDLPEESSLAAVLGGRAACSATLRELDLSGFVLGPKDLMQLAVALAEPKAVRLHVLRLYNCGPGVAYLLAVLEALQGRAGTALRELEIYTAVGPRLVTQFLEDGVNQHLYPQLKEIRFRYPRGEDGAFVWNPDEALKEHLEIMRKYW